MNTKKLISGVLAGTMLVGCMAVPVSAASYTPKMKVMPQSGTVTKLTAADGSDKVKSTWWNPQTFSNSLKITDKAVTVNLTCTSEYDVNADEFYGDQAPFIFVFSSKTGAIYGGAAADESYTEGKKQKMVEYCGIRGDGKVYTKGDWNAGSAWVDGALSTGTCKGGITVAGEAGWGENPVYEDWCKNNNKGYAGKITAVLDGTNAIVNFEYQGTKSTTTIPVKDSGSNGTYLCLASGNSGGTLSNMSYSYAAVSVKDVKASIGKKTFNYNGKVQKPKLTINDGTKTSTFTKSGSNDSFTVKYQDDSSKNNGSYTIQIDGKGDFQGYTKTLTYEIKPIKAKITKLSVKTKKFSAAKLKKKKATFNVTVTMSKKTYLKSAKKDYTKISISSSKPSVVKGALVKKYGNKVAVTVAKKAPKGKYELRFSTIKSANGNYTEADKKILKITITK